MKMDKVAKFYDENTEREWRRLVKDPYHTLEFMVNMHYIRKHFPPQGKMLDAGAGPGRYSIELCRMGYEVVLFDLSPECVATAKEKIKVESENIQENLLEFIIGDIRDLSCFETDSFDGVLCLDPISYLEKESDRIMALSELTRVAKPGAIVCIAARGYLALIRTILREFSHELIEPQFQNFVDHGNIRASGSICHFFRAHEIRNLAESQGLITLDMAGCEGLSTGLDEFTNQLGQDKEKWKIWTDIVLKTSAEPAVIDMAEHILYVGQIPDKY